MKKIRIGIDVGGTFTKAVAIDIIDKRIVGKKSVPTTHSTAGGVSNGIIQTLLSLIDEFNIKNEEI
jgi:N-methylhydantoinase A